MEPVTKDLGKVMMTLEGEHSLEREYEVLSVVSSNGTSYISKKNVPVNTPITNTEYWQFFGSLGVTPKLRKNIEEGYIEISYDNGITWEDLIELSAIQGPQGIQGVQGPEGEPAVAIENYITVEATLETIDVTDVLPSVGSADTVYRVSNWDGIQYNETTYSEYGWYDNAYKKLATRQIGIDNEPIADSQNLVKSGGIALQISQLGQYANNPEWVKVVTDANDKILYGVKTDGKFYFGNGCPPQVVEYILDKISELSLDEYKDIVTFLNGLEKGDKTLQTLFNEKVNKEEGKSLIDAEYASTKSTINNPKFLNVILDAEGKLLAGRTPDGAAFENVGFSTPKVSIDGHIIDDIEDPEERSEIITDAEGKIISYRDSDGVKHEEVGIETDSASINHLNLTDTGITEFQQALKDAGFKPGGVGDWSDYISNKGKDPLHLPIPRLAYVNITNAKGNLTWPTSKTADFEAIMEFADMQGNYFKKNIIFNAQGNSSMAYIKKNGSIKMFDGSVYNSKGKKGKGDKFGVKFGNLVSQTTYHIKAFYADYFKGVSWISYQIALAVANTHNIFEDRTWKKGLFKNYQFTDEQFNNPQIDDQNLQIDNGALCQPDGFPCIVYLNGEFYGIYVWLIKKDAANFNMEDKEEHIHLDGRLDNSSIFNANGNAANMNWNPASDNGFEVRNPEDLICMFPYTKEGEDCWEYNADVNANQELAGIRTISEIIPQYDSETNYTKSVIVLADDRIYLSKVENNIGHNPIEAKATDHSKVLDKATDYWIDVTFTNQVKTYILTLSTYGNRVNAETTIASKKALFETLFDVSNLIDYEVVQAAVHDIDGFSKNWQWTTWDGITWFVNNYDKDCSFGNDFTGIYTADAPSEMTTWPRGYGWMIGFLVDNYNSELKARWTELVNKGIFTKEYIINIFKEWTQRIGSVNYNKEYTKWPEAPCNRDSGINTNYWRVKELNYVINPTTTYDETASYEINDECIIAVNSYEVTFVCINPCTGQNPIIKTYSSNPTKLGYRDNLWRVSKFIEKNLQTINMFVNN